MRFISLVAAFILTASLCACVPTGNNEASSSSAAASSSSQSSATDASGSSGTPQSSEVASSASSVNSESSSTASVTTINAAVNGTTLEIALADNESARAFAELLASGPLTVEMHDYGNFEKVGPLGTTLPTTDESITTEPGDVILFQGNQITIYYAPNTWNFTRLGKVQNTDAATLKDVLGEGDVTVTFSL